MSEHKVFSAHLPLCVDFVNDMDGLEEFYMVVI
jgi:hypothetical protein